MSEETLLQKIARWDKDIEDMEKRMTWKWAVDQVKKGADD
jgi:hypothetical protein